MLNLSGHREVGLRFGVLGLRGVGACMGVKA